MLEAQKQFLSDPNLTKVELIKESPNQPPKLIVRPWVRYAARFLDQTLYLFISGIILGVLSAIFHLNYQSHIILVLLALLSLVILMESSLLSVMGTTPGKWLLNIKLSDRNGNALTFNNAIKRTVKLWMYGQAFGIPFLSLCAYIYSFIDLKRSKVTIWDKAEQISVKHERIGFIRGTIAILIIAFVLLIALIVRLSHIVH